MARVKRRSFNSALALQLAREKRRKQKSSPPEKEVRKQARCKARGVNIKRPSLTPTRPLPPPTCHQTRSKTVAEKAAEAPKKKPTIRLVRQKKRDDDDDYVPSDQAADGAPEDVDQLKDVIDARAYQQVYEDQTESHVHFLAGPNGLIPTSFQPTAAETWLSRRGKRLPKMGSNFGNGDESDKIRAQLERESRKAPKPMSEIYADDDTEVSDSDDDEDPKGDLEEIVRRESDPKASGEELTKTWRSKGKQPAREGQPEADIEMIDADEEVSEDEKDVDEGSIDYNDHTPSEHELEDDGIDDFEQDEVIPISSDEEDEVDDAAGGGKKKTKKNKKTADPMILDVQKKPWAVPGFDISMREQYEQMFGQVQMRPVNNSWSLTELYQVEKDAEMLRYLQDFPLDEWVIPNDQAQQAYFRLLERTRWRQIGVKIYGPSQMPEMIPYATPFSRSQIPQQMPQPMPQMQQGPNGNVDPRNYYHGPPANGGRPGSIPQQKIMYAPPPNNRQMGPPQVHRSQPAAMPMQPTPSHGLPGQHQQRGHGQPMMSAPQFGHPQHVGGPHGMPYQIAPPNGHGHNQPQHVNHANVQMHHPQPGQAHAGMPGMPQQPASHLGNTPAVHGEARNEASMPPTSTSVVKPRRKKATPPPPTPPPPAPTPPYEKRQRPQNQTRQVAKGNRKNARKSAEAEVFPWHRVQDFKQERANAVWSEEGYDPDIMRSMAACRRMNIPIIGTLDEENAEKQRLARYRKNGGKRKGKGVAALAPAGSPAADGDNAGEGPSTGPANGAPLPRRKGENIGGDPYYSGNFSFATEKDREKALAMNRKTPDDIIEAAEQGKIDWELCKEIKICWNPGKKGTTQDLVQAVFRIYDTLITRKQLETRPIFTKRAAECIIDFCPDMLWRETLLRICSESGMGNKDVRDRFCFNGCYADKATMTKRIAAALGQKQTNNPSKKAAKAKKEQENKEKEERGEKVNRGRGAKAKDSETEQELKEEDKYFKDNQQDFYNYVAFFGRRSSKRVGLGGKRKRIYLDLEEADGEVESAEKRAKVEDEEGTSPALSSDLSETQSLMDAEEDHEDESEEEELGGDGEEDDDDEDAVSVQSDGLLDEIED